MTETTRNMCLDTKYCVTFCDDCKEMILDHLKDTVWLPTKFNKTMCVTTAIKHKKSFKPVSGITAWLGQKHWKLSNDSRRSVITTIRSLFK
jgi:hypothetical protein